MTGESAASVTAAAEGPLRAAVAGLPADDPVGASSLLERAVVRNSSARMAVECAVYDLAARAAGVPLFRYLGGREQALRTDMTLSAAATAAEARELIRTAVQHVAAGFRTLKVKTGAGGDDVATLAAVRKAVGPHVILRTPLSAASFSRMTGSFLTTPWRMRHLPRRLRGGPPRGHRKAHPPGTDAGPSRRHKAHC